jgi:uncharacterized membrane protein YeaQ/YmgE (transglycosylase-associated protein family)
MGRTVTFKFKALKNEGVFMHYTMGVHDLVWFLVVGGLTGWVASVLVTGGGLGIFGDIFIGIAGAFLGGFLAYQFNIAVYGFWGVAGMSILGAVILLVILRLFSPSRRTA